MYIGIDTFDWFVTLLHYLFLNENRFGFWLPELPISCKSNKRQSAVFSPADHRLRIAQISGQFSSPRSWNSVDCICNHTIICHADHCNCPPAVRLAEGLVSRWSLRPFACCPPRMSAQDKICQRWQRRKRKIRAAWTVWQFIICLTYSVLGTQLNRSHYWRENYLQKKRPTSKRIP